MSDDNGGTLCFSQSGPVSVYFPEGQNFRLDIPGVPTVDTDDIRQLSGLLATWCQEVRAHLSQPGTYDGPNFDPLYDFCEKLGLAGAPKAPSEKRNCWTCEHSDEENGSCRLDTREDVLKWIFECPGAWQECMPPRDADGCPGWTQK